MWWPNCEKCNGRAAKATGICNFQDNKEVAATEFRPYDDPSANLLALDRYFLLFINVDFDLSARFDDRILSLLQKT